MAVAAPAGLDLPRILERIASRLRPFRAPIVVAWAASFFFCWIAIRGVRDDGWPYARRVRWVASLGFWLSTSWLVLTSAWFDPGNKRTLVGKPQLIRWYFALFALLFAVAAGYMVLETARLLGLLGW